MEYHSKYTGAEVDALLDKVENGEVGGKVTVDSVLSTESENPVMNKVITAELNNKADKGEVTAALNTKADKNETDTKLATLSEYIDSGLEEVISYPLKDEGYVRYANGAFQRGTPSMNTGYVPVVRRGELYYSSNISPEGAAVAFFDRNKNYLKDISLSGLDSKSAGSIDLSQPEYIEVAYFIISIYDYSLQFDDYLGEMYFPNSIETKVRELGDKIDIINADIEPTPTYELTDVGYVAIANGSITQNTSARNTGLIPISGYDSVECMTSLSSEGAAIGVYDVRKKYIANASIVGNGKDVYRLNLKTIPNAYYVIISYYDSSLQFNDYYCKLVKKEKLVERVNAIESEQARFKDFSVSNIYYKNLYDSTRVIQGYEVYGDGKLRPQDASAYYKVEVSALVSGFLTISRLPNYTGYARYWSFWDENGNVLKNDVLDNRYASNTFEIPAYAKYFLISIYQRATTIPNIEGIQIEYGDMVSDYVDGLVETEKISIKKGETGLVLPSIKANKLNILAFGDSITETDTISYHSIDNPYTTAIKRWSRSNWLKWVNTNEKSLYRVGEIRNYAKSGATIHNTHESDPRQFVGFQISECLADLDAPSDGIYYGKSFVPDVVVISAGTNDGGTSSTFESAMAKTIMSGNEFNVDATIENLDSDNFSEALRADFLRLRKAFPNALIVYATPIQRVSHEIPTTTLSVAKSLSERYGVIVADCYAESGIVRDFAKTDGTSGDLYDGLHPNEVGQKKMARCIMNKILSHLLFFVE